MYKKCFNRLEDLPTREPFRFGGHSAFKHYWGKGGSQIRKTNGAEPWVHVERILKKFKGKQVNKAFSKYCSIVPSCQQYWFWKELDKINVTRQRRGQYDYDMSHWYIDKDNRIQYHKVKKDKLTYSIKSADYEEGWINHMGEVITDDEYNKLSSNRWINKRYVKKIYKKWTPIILSGEVFNFKKKDAAFFRCLADENGKADKMQREYDKYAEQKAYSFLTREEEEEKNKDVEKDIIKRDSHGFDEDSFTNNGGRLN